MALFLDLVVTNITILFTNPFSLIELVYVLGLKAAGLVTFTSFLLAKAVINFQVNVCWRVMILTLSCFSSYTSFERHYKGRGW